MALIVEPGSGLADSESYAAVAYCDTYHAARGNVTWTGTDALKEQALRRATAYMEGFSWAGYRSRGRLQALAWPRSGVVDVEGFGIAADEIPVGVKNCCAELALRELTTPGVLTPDVKASDAVKREKIGPLEVEYSNPASTVSSARTMVSVIEPFLRGLLSTGSSGSALSGSTVRA